MEYNWVTVSQLEDGIVVRPKVSSIVCVGSRPLIEVKCLTKNL